MKNRRSRSIPVAKKPYLWKLAEMVGLKRSEIGEKIGNAALREKVKRELDRRSENRAEYWKDSWNHPVQG